MEPRRKVSEEDVDDDGGTEKLNENESEEILQTKICSVCEEELREEFFRCLTCSDSQTEADVFWEACITSPHIKKQHQITDYRGYEPKICGTHRLLSSFYCENCSVVFCFKCRTEHAKHDYVNVSEVAADVRKNIFLYLEKFHELVKPIKKRTADMKDIWDEHTLITSSLSSDNISETFIETCRRILDKKSAGWSYKLFEHIKCSSEQLEHQEAKKNFEFLSETSETSDYQISHLIGLLRLNDSWCIEGFLDLRQALDESLGQQRSVLESRTILKWYSSLESFLEASLKEFVEKIEIPKVCEIEIEKLTFSKKIPLFAKVR